MPKIEYSAKSMSGINEDASELDKDDKSELINDIEENEQGDLSYIPETERFVYIEKAQLSVFELHRRFKRGDIILKPFYQRGEVWVRAKKSKLVESVLRSIPIPSIYFAETEGDKWEVVDGQQRLNAFFDYLQDEYSLMGLPVLTNLNNKCFSEIGNYQRKIEDYQLHIFIIKKESHPDIRFDIFERINEGATQLNAQEIRNSIYRGNRIDFLKELATNSNFRRVTKGKIQTNRLKDEEAVLRFLAFYCRGYKEYRGNLNAFLNGVLDDFEYFIRDKNFIKNVFSETMACIDSVFGEQAFMKRDMQRKKMNISLFDIISYSFAKSDKKIIKNNKILLVKALENLIENDLEFNKAITSNTLTKSNVEYRFETWLATLNNILKEGE